MPTASPTIVAMVKPYVTCPNPLWECIVQYESNFNQYAVGDTGTSFGLFQLHIGGQADAALAAITKQTGLTGWAAITYLMQNVAIQAQYGMPAINDAWQKLKNSYSATSRTWWLQFCALSGHPGGDSGDPVTNAYVDKFMNQMVLSNAFGIQQISGNSLNGGASAPTVDNTWLQSLINLPPHQACSIIWRRSCPGAKSSNNGVIEGGMDLPSPGGTKVYSLASGTVIGAGYFRHPDGSPGYGVVTVRSLLPDGTTADIYYQHINLSNNIILCGQTGGYLYYEITGPNPSNQVIQAGQFLGTVVEGVNEVEVGVNAEWGGIWGTGHTGPWLDDPEDLIRSLMSSGGGASSFQPLSTGNDPLDSAISEMFTTTHDGFQLLSQNTGLIGPLELFDQVQQFKPFKVPQDTNASVPIIGGIQSGLSYPTRLMIGVISFVIQNTMAFVIRSFFVSLSFVLIIALIINITSKVSQSSEGENHGNSLPSIADAAKIGAMVV